MFKKIQFTFRPLMIVVIVLGLFLSVGTLWAAWTAPAQTPPGGNPPGPVYVGTSTASSAYVLGGFGVGNALYVAGASSLLGNVGIGTDPREDYALTVNGKVWANDGYNGSDIRFKKDIKELEGTLEKIRSLRGVSYRWNRGDFPERNFDDGRQIGVIAQELEKEFPELVHTGADGYKGVSYEKLTAILLQAIKEQQAQIDELEAKIK